MSAGDERPEAGECRSEDDLPLVVGRRARDLGAGGVGDIGELFRAADDDEVVETARDRKVALVEREGARRPSPLDAHGGKVPCAQTRVIEDQGGDLLLVDQGAGRHVPEEQGTEVPRGELRVHQCLEPRFDADLAERPVPELPELGHADAENGDLAHGQLPPMWILPRYFA